MTANVGRFVQTAQVQEGNIFLPFSIFALALSQVSIDQANEERKDPSSSLISHDFLGLEPVPSVVERPAPLKGRSQNS